MAKTRDFPLKNYASGTHQITKQTPNGLAGFDIHIGRCTSATPTLWPNVSTGLSVMVEGSYDGGATFTGGRSRVDNVGGIKIDDDGIEIVEEVIPARFVPEVNAVRITITITNGPLYSYGDITVF